jgi:hypothetical protein
VTPGISVYFYPDPRRPKIWGVTIVDQHDQVWENEIHSDSLEFDNFVDVIVRIQATATKKESSA